MCGRQVETNFGRPNIVLTGATSRELATAAEVTNSSLNFLLLLVFGLFSTESFILGQRYTHLARRNCYKTFWKKSLSIPGHFAVCFLLNISRIFYTLSSLELLREKSKVWVVGENRKVCEVGAGRGDSGRTRHRQTEREAGRAGRVTVLGQAGAGQVVFTPQHFLQPVLWRCFTGSSNLLKFRGTN